MRRGEVVVAQGRVAEVRERSSEQDVEDLGEGVLLPGLVNAHCHLELSHLASRVRSSGDFVAWVEELVAARAQDDGLGATRLAAAAAITDLSENGTAAVGDVSNLLAHLDLLGASPLRSVVFFELIGWDPAAAPRVMEAARARLREAGGRNPFPNVEVRLAAHAPHSVSADLFRRLVAEGEPSSLHLAESPHEARFLAEGDEAWSAFLSARGLGHVPFAPPGVSPVRLMDDLGVFARPGLPLLAVHCVQASPEDCRLLAARGVVVALCPRSNARLGVGLPPLPDLLAAGVRLCLGSDSLASAPSLDVLEDARVLHVAFPEVPSRVLVEMATSGGAIALDLPDLGTIAPGRRAALAYAPSAGVPADPYRYLLENEVRLRSVRT